MILIKTIKQPDYGYLLRGKVWLFIFFLAIQLVAQQKPDFIIAGGSRGGNYYNTAKFIAGQYDRAFPENRVYAIETKGSNENINLLKNNSVDFAIIQRNVLINNIYDEDEGIKNIDVILPLFQEKLRIYSHLNKSQPINILNKFSKDTSGLVFGFTSLNGTAHQTFQKVIKFLNIDDGHFKKVTGNYKTLTKKFKDGKVDYLVSFSLPLAELDSLDNTNYLYLTKEQAQIIANRVHNLGMATLANNNNQKTLGTWSFLVGRKKSISYFKPQKKLISSLFEQPDTIYGFYQNIIKQSYENLERHNPHEILQLRSLPVIFPLKKIMGFQNINFGPYVMLLFFLMTFSLLHYHYKGRFFPKIKWKSIWNRYKHFQFGFLALIFVYFASIEMLVYAEKAFFHDVGIKSQILNLTRRDLHTWVVITTITGNSNGIFPLSTLGKIMLALNSLNFWIGTLFIGVSEYVMYKMNKKRKLGLMETKYTKHLVIFGWNDSTEKFILEIMNDAKIYMNQKLHLVCVVPNINIVRESAKKIKELHDNKEIDIIQGDAIDKHILELAKVELAYSIILLADEKSKLADERTVMRAHAISRYTKTKKHNGRVYKTTLVGRTKNKIKDFLVKKTTEDTADYKRYKIESNADAAYMIAELNNGDYKESLIDAGANEIVVAGNYRHAIMKQSLFNHGISKVLDEIMQYNDDNEFYKIDLSLPQNRHLVGKTFDELLILLRQQNILLVAIHIVFHDENDNIIIDQNIIKELLQTEEGEGITRDVIINPTKDAEKNRKVDSDDHLIVLALNMKAVENGVKNLKDL